MLCMEISNTVTKDPSGYHRKMMGKSGEDRPCTKGAQRKWKKSTKGSTKLPQNFHARRRSKKKTGVRKNTRNFLCFSFLKHAKGNLLGVRYPRPKRWGNHEVTCPVPGGAIQKIRGWDWIWRCMDKSQAPRTLHKICKRGAQERINQEKPS